MARRISSSTNAIVVDYWGVVKADVGVRDGRICAIGKAGNPDIQDGVTPGAGDRAVHGNHRGRASDPHRRRHRRAHPFHQPAAGLEALYSGITTMIGGGTGPAEGTRATTCTPGAWNIHRMIEATQSLPMNFGFSREGQRLDARGARRAAARRRDGPQAARGLGHDTRRDRQPR